MLKVDNRPFPKLLNNAVGLVVSTSVKVDLDCSSRFSLSSLILPFSRRSCILLASGFLHRINRLVTSLAARSRRVTIMTVVDSRENRSSNNNYVKCCA